jgi:anti-sigma B factor antagonist
VHAATSVKRALRRASREAKYVNHDLGLKVSMDRPDQVRLALHGDIDMASAPAVLDSLLCAAISYDDHVIVADMAKVTFCDSTGIAALVEANQRIRNSGSRLVVTNVPDPIARIFGLVGLDAVFDLQLDDAVAPVD